MDRWICSGGSTHNELVTNLKRRLRDAYLLHLSRRLPRRGIEGSVVGANQHHHVRIPVRKGNERAANRDRLIPIEAGVRVMG